MTRKSTQDDWNVLAQSLCFRDERHMYEVMYEEEGRSVQEIADILQCGTATLNRRMHAYQIRKRPRGGARTASEKASVLFYMDQRVIMALSNKLLAELLNMSYSRIYSYKRWKSGGSYVGYNLSSQGSEKSMEGVRS